MTLQTTFWSVRQVLIEVFYSNIIIISATLKPTLCFSLSIIRYDFQCIIRYDFNFKPFFKKSKDCGCPKTEYH